MKLAFRTILALAAYLWVGLAIAGETSFSLAAFEAAQKPILIDIAAPWCPTCKVQAPILTKLYAEPRFKDLQVFTVDFDTQKDALRALKAQRQSTLIVFKGAIQKNKGRREEWES